MEAEEVVAAAVVVVDSAVAVVAAEAVSVEAAVVVVAVEVEDKHSIARLLN